MAAWLLIQQSGGGKGITVNLIHKHILMTE